MASLYRWPKHEHTDEDSGHVLRATTVPTGTKFFLQVNKPAGRNVLVADSLATMMEFDRAWFPKKWREVDRCEGAEFFCIRYVPITETIFLVWRVLHIDNVPYDVLTTFVGTEAHMRNLFAYCPPLDK